MFTVREHFVTRQTQNVMNGPRNMHPPTMEQRQLQHEEPKVQTAEIVQRLNSKKVAERVEAEQALAQMGPEAVEELLRLLEIEARKRKRNTRLYIGLTVGMVLFMIVASALFDLDIGGFCGLFGAFSGLAAVSQMQKNAARALAKFDDKRVVGPLAEALGFDDKGLRQEAERVLARLLPTLQASDASLLNDDQRKMLNRSLRGKNADLICAILQAYQQVGDEAALPHVERLANGEVATTKAKKVREAAQACLPFLRERAAQEQAAQTLLRPATAPGSPAEILLRPAQGAPEGDPSLLLRPSDLA